MQIQRDSTGETMATAKARQAAIKKAASQVKSGGPFVRRAAASGTVRSASTGRVAAKKR